MSFVRGGEAVTSTYAAEKHVATRRRLDVDRNENNSCGHGDLAVRLRDDHGAGRMPSHPILAQVTARAPRSPVCKAAPSSFTLVTTTILTSRQRSAVVAHARPASTLSTRRRGAARKRRSRRTRQRFFFETGETAVLRCRRFVWVRISQMGHFCPLATVAARVRKRV